MCILTHNSISKYVLKENNDIYVPIFMSKDIHFE
jgi:hypothetical protein